MPPGGAAAVVETSGVSHAAAARSPDNALKLSSRHSSRGFLESTDTGSTPLDRADSKMRRSSATIDPVAFRSDSPSDSFGRQTQMTRQNESRTDPGKKLSLLLFTISQ